ncbi:hypothetical protein JHK85_028983 [Glycine max]|nr:hypothetical protein JHK85_028983 [Glycine max]
MEEKKDGEDSTFNKGEAEVTMAHAKRLVQSGVLPPDIGIITPYAAQMLKNKELSGIVFVIVLILLFSSSHTTPSLNIVYPMKASNLDSNRKGSKHGLSIHGENT